MSAEREVASPSESEIESFAETKAKARELETAEEISQRPIENQASDIGGVPGISVMQGLITATFFNDLFCNFAYRRYTHLQSEDRVSALIARHSTFYRLCRYADFGYRFIAALAVLGALMAIAAGAIIKIFFPSLLQ